MINKITIIGVGLIGGSLARSLKEKNLAKVVYNKNCEVKAIYTKNIYRHSKTPDFFSIQSSDFPILEATSVLFSILGGKYRPVDEINIFN